MVAILPAKRYRYSLSLISDKKFICAVAAPATTSHFVMAVAA